ncbi:glycosyltransferase [Magnetococcus sp. PR-3]|uniref:glycosyltransferase n=1 Tax=Magnetococcus sp. PR-3 TaxID=3120355 RepID=UPI002FCE0342
MRKRVLMVAFHFPPAMGYSGTQRALKFCRYLPDYQWDPIVLSAHTRSYAQTSDAQLSEIPEQVPVHRSFALDATRHLAIAGRYFGFTAQPDRWRSWRLPAIWQGLRLIKRYKPDLIWATYPVATSHRIAHTLSLITGLPWVADFRDGQWTETFPVNAKLRETFATLEARHIASANRVVVTTPGIQRLYSSRYPFLDPGKVVVIPNGFDEENFQNLEPQTALNPDKPIHLLHSGVIYPGQEERDPVTLMEVLGRLHRLGVVGPETLKITFRGSGMEAHLQNQIDQNGLGDMVHVAPTLPYSQALEEMAQVDGLLLLQGANFSHLIPAKLFEYLRMGKPILALADPNGDAADLMLESGVTTIWPLHDTSEMENALPAFVEQVRCGAVPVANQDAVGRFSRQALTGDLATLFDTVDMSDLK